MATLSDFACLSSLTDTPPESFTFVTPNTSDLTETDPVKEPEEERVDEEITDEEPSLVGEEEIGLEEDGVHPKVPLFTLSINDPLDWIPFLMCEEKAVQLKCLDKLYEALRDYPDLKSKFIERGVIDQTIKLIYTEEPLIEAHSFKLLAEIIKNDYDLELPASKIKKVALYALKELKSCPILPIQEYSSLILARLSHIPKIRKTLLVDYEDDLEWLFFRLKHPDPDVICNTLQIFYNMFRDECCGQVIVNYESFYFTFFFNQMKSKYVKIQEIAVDIVNYLISKNIPELNELFHKELGLIHMFDFLTEHKWRDQHHKIFPIIRIVSKNDLILDNYELDWIEVMIDYLSFIEDERLIEEDLLLLLQLSECAQIREDLISFGIIEEIRPFIQPNNTENNKCTAIQIYTILTANLLSLKNIIKDNMIEKMFNIIEEDKYFGRLSHCAIEFLQNLTEKGLTVCKYQDVHLDRLKQWLLEYKSLPHDFLCHLLNIFRVFTIDSEMKERIISRSLFQSLLNILQEKSVSEDALTIRIKSANVILSLANNVDNVWDKYFEECFDTEEFMSLLRSITNMKLIESIIDIIIYLMGNSESITLKFIKSDCLKWIVQNKKALLPNMYVEKLIRAFFKNFPPIKFAYLGYLDFYDQTKSGFYCQRSFPCNNIDFPMLDEMRLYKPSCSHLAYIFVYEKVPMNERLIDYEISDNFEKTKPTVSEMELFRNKEGLYYSESPSYNAVNIDTDSRIIIEAQEQECEGYEETLEDESYSCSHLEKHVSNASDDGLMPFYHSCGCYKKNLPTVLPEWRDNTMNKYVKYIKFASKNFESFGILRAKWTKKRVKLLCYIVIVAMGKKMPDKECADKFDTHTLLLRINEVKMDLISSVIPLGKLEVGFKFERALLFKCLADVIGLPCRLVRGAEGVAWNEICIMSWDPPYCDLPLSRLIPTHVVDLWHNPGKLLPIGSAKCQSYCGSKAESLISIPPKYIDILDNKKI